MEIFSRSQWSRGLRRRSAAARLMRLWVRIPPRELMFVCCDCCVSSGRGLWVELITRPEESYRLWCVVLCVCVCDLETSWMRRPWPTGGCCAKIKKKKLCLRLSDTHVTSNKHVVHWTSKFCKLSRPTGIVCQNNVGKKKSLPTRMLWCHIFLQCACQNVNVFRIFLHRTPLAQPPLTDFTPY